MMNRYALLGSVMGVWLLGGMEMCEAAPPNEAPELTLKASQAIDKGLQFLLDNQKEDGSWAASEKGDRATAITSLGLMAFMSRGEFPGGGPNGEALDRAKNWLLKQAQVAPDGYLGSTMYEHGFATLALTEMWGMTGDREDQDAIEKAIKAAIDVIVRSQNSTGGWRYQPNPNAGADTSVTVTVFIGLASARQAGIPIPNDTIAKVLEYLESAVEPKSGGFVYVPLGQQGTALQAAPGRTGGGAYVAQLAGARDSEMVKGALRYMDERSPGIFKDCGHFYYSHYYAIQAMVQSGDERYAKWYPQIRDALITRQMENGSWQSKAEGEKAVGHETPMAIIILATPHHYIPIYQR